MQTNCHRSRVGSSAVGAYAEPRDTGAPGPLTLALLRRLRSQIGRTSRFPPPDGHHGWTEDAVYELICTLFEEKPGLVVGCLVKLRLNLTRLHPTPSAASVAERAGIDVSFLNA